MGIKSFFGKGLMSMLQAHQDQANRALGAQATISTDMERMFGSVNPAVVAFRISNGYVVRTMDTHSDIVGSRSSGFHYCKDHQEIAEHIVASEAKRKLGIGEEYQQEMFAAEKARAVAMQGKTLVSRAPNRI